jgi:hypothetical protein
VHFLSRETVVQAIARSATKVCRFVDFITNFLLDTISPGLWIITEDFFFFFFGCCGGGGGGGLGVFMFCSKCLKY